MKQIYTTLTLLTSMSLVACSTVSNYSTQNTPDKQYKTAQTSNANIQTAAAEDRYQIPTVPMASSTSQDLSTPPNQVNAQTVTPSAAPVQTAQATPQASHSGVAKLTPGGLLISQNYNEAWPKVGHALTSSGYQIMEKDSSLGTYYVVDKSTTGGKVKRDTPIYQIKVQNSGSSTIVTLLNSQNQPADSATTSKILGSVANKMN